MSLVIFSGECLQCALSNKKVNMRENQIPFWECPDCHLQILIEREKAVVLRFRGKGKFKYNFSQVKADYLVEESGEDSYRNDVIIYDEGHLKNYLENHVEKVKEYTLTALIDSFVTYKYGNSSKNNYIRQSNYFKIDFEDNSIENKLLKRDLDRNHSNLYLHSRLYRFLKVILEKYHNVDNSWLPEMGMSKIEHYLCLKHFPTNSRTKIDTNPIFAKQSLKDLTEDLIEIIYFDKKVLLSFDVDESKTIAAESVIK